MADLCIRQNGTIKKYELKDSVSSSPKLAVKQGGYTRYLPLKQGTKSGELSLRVQGKTYYAYSEKILPVEMTDPVRLSDMHFARSQYDADHYDWGTDEENNKAFKTTYNVGGHEYYYNQWGGTGPFRMYKTEPYSDYKTTPPTFEYVMTEPLYFVWTDQSTSLYTHAHGGETYILDVLKNGESLYSYKGTSTPILFETDDVMSVIVMFGGFNTQEDSGATAFTYGWYPKLRPASKYKFADAPFGFYCQCNSSVAGNSNFYGNLVDWGENPSASPDYSVYRTSPEYYIAQHDYKYYPSDNSKFAASPTYWDIYGLNMPSFGINFHVYSSKCIVNSTRYDWNQEFEIHAGDRVTILFRLDGNMPNTSYTLNVGIRPKLRLAAE